MNAVYKNILLLVFVLSVMFISAEIFFRAYYAYLDVPLGANTDEKCFKTMKAANQFDLSAYMENHPLIGTTSKKNYNSDKVEEMLVNGTKIKKITPSGLHYNSEGMHNVDEFSIDKPSDVNLRIALFGDSFTCGLDVPHLFGMGPLLNKFIPKSEVLNFCLQGKGIETMYARYMLEGRKYSPDVVVFNVYVDDLLRPYHCSLFTPNLQIVNDEIKILEREYPSAEDFYNNYELSKYESYFLKHYLFVISEKRKPKVNIQRGFELFDVMLDDLKKRTEEDNSTLIVSIIEGPRPDGITTEYYEKLVTLVESKEILLLDSKEYFASENEVYGNQSPYFVSMQFPAGHFSVTANARFAQGLRKLIEGQESMMYNALPYYYFFNSGHKLYLIAQDGEEITVLEPYYLVQEYTTDAIAS